MAEFSLNVDEIEEEVQKTIKVEEEKLEDSNIKDQAKDNAVAIFDADFDDPTQRDSIVKPMESFGLADIRKSNATNDLLSTRMVDFAKSGSNANTVGEQLAELNLQLKDLDPSGIDFAKKGILGKISDPVRKYFNKYEKSEVVIANIIKSLDKSRTVLENDNTTLLAEEDELRAITKKLMTDIELGKKMDESLEEQIREAEINGVDPDKIQYVKEEILFPLRQRVMDMQQMIVVNQQGIVSLNVVRRNNKELIRGVDRAKNVTVTALRTGVMIASALYDQKIVMEKIGILNKTTENIIQANAKMLREQGAEIQKQSAETMISPEVLKAAFNDALQAVEDISTYKEQALPKMKETIEIFNDMAVDGQKVVDRLETKN